MSFCKKWMHQVLLFFSAKFLYILLSFAECHRIPANNSSFLIQENGQLYFTTTQAVSSKNELRVWYSPDYIQLFAPTHRLSLLTTNGNDEQGIPFYWLPVLRVRSFAPPHY
jgi:hypothetical protein